MLDLWFRLYVHALLRESRIFPGIELCDKAPEYSPYGYTDLWKGDYHGKSVCVRAIRLQDPARLADVKTVRGSFLFSEPCSVCFTLGIPPREKRCRTQPSSQCTPCYRSFGDTVSTLHHHPVDAKREHRPVHPDEFKCQSAAACMCLSTSNLTKMAR